MALPGTAREVLSLRALNRATLARQMLLARQRLPVARAIERLAGLQAQAPNPPYVGLWSRLEDFPREALTEALRRRRVVRLSMMRATLHLVSARDALAWRPLLDAAHQRGLLGNHKRALEGVDRAEALALGRALLDERARTSTELGQALLERWPRSEPASLAGLIRNNLPLVHLPPAGSWNSHQNALLQRLGAWLGKDEEEQGAATQDDLLLRYLAAFGPATLADAGAWSGLTGWKAVAERLGMRLRRFEGPQGETLFDLPRAPRPDEATPAPPRLLAEWDSLLLAHEDRGRVLDEAHRPRVFTINGIVRGTVLIDGFVAGTWKIERAKGAATAVLEPFARWPEAGREGAEQEALRLLAFAADAPGERHAVRVARPAA